jgi:CheY-like chemotaxis protein
VAFRTGIFSPKIFTTMNLMIIDDDEDDHYLFSEAVREIDPSIHLTHCYECEQALTILKEAQSNLPDLIFLDLNMPRINGMQCLEIIKRQKQLQDIPVIIFSTSTNKRNIEEVLRLGAAAYLAKPCGMSELVTAIRQIVKSRMNEI